MRKLLLFSVAAALAQVPVTTRPILRLDSALDALFHPTPKSNSSRAASVSPKAPIWVRKRTNRLSPLHRHSRQRDLEAHPGRSSVRAPQQCGYSGPEVFRWGGINNNGFDRSDPKFEEFPSLEPMASPSTGKAAHCRNLRWPLPHARQEKRQTHDTG